jgi:DNA-binding MarR family transcriptional regulator
VLASTLVRGGKQRAEGGLCGNLHFAQKERILAPEEQSQTSDDELDPVVVTVLLHLWTAWQESPGKPWSLPKLCKRTELAMSTLRRTLSRLQGAGLVALTMNEDEERTIAALTPDGFEFATQLFRPE